MALAVTTSYTIADDMDTDSSALGVLDTDFYLTATGSIGIDTDVETHDLFNGNITAVDLTSTGLSLGMLCMTQPTLDTKANGGMRIIVKDSVGNISRWNVGGLDTYNGGWEVMVCHTSVTPDSNSGTAADLTDIVAIGGGWKCLAKSKLAQNCFIDRASYGTGVMLKVTGTNTTANAGWSEVLSVADSADATIGYLKSQVGSYIGKGLYQIGDDSGTLSTAFTDTKSKIFFGDQPVSATYYGIKIQGNATGTTNVTMGTKIGTGDAAVGADGNTIVGVLTAYPWVLTATTNITSFNVYGSSFLGMAASSIANANNEFITTTFDGSKQLTIGTADILKCTVSNTTETTLGAVLMPSGNTHTTRDSFFNNNAQAIEFTSTGTYDDDANQYAGNTYDIRNNSAGAVTVNKLTGSNIATYINIGISTTTISASFTLTLTNIPNPTNVTIVNSTTRAELQHQTVTTGSTTYVHGGGSTIDILFNTLSYDPNLSDQYDLLLPSADSSIKVNPVDDPNYANP